MKYKIKLKGSSVALIACGFLLALLGVLMVGNALPQDHPSNMMSYAIVGTIMTCIGLVVMILFLCTVEWDYLKITDFDKQWEDEINKRVNEKLSKISRELNKTIE
jgi:cell division protein FtsW (lipid II flippase)